MKITKNAKAFAITNTVSTLWFLITINHLVSSKQFGKIAPWAITYGLIWAISGAVLGATDKSRKYRGNVGIQYSLISFLLGLVALWLSKLFLPAIMPVGYGYLILVSAVVTAATAIQYYTGNKDPKGISKKEAFK